MRRDNLTGWGRALGVAGVGRGATAAFRFAFMGRAERVMVPAASSSCFFDVRDQLMVWMRGMHVVFWVRCGAVEVMMVQTRHEPGMR
eukprot:2347763-Rhodomonas_salina.2